MKTWNGLWRYSYISKFVLNSVNPSEASDWQAQHSSTLNGGVEGRGGFSPPYSEASIVWCADTKSSCFSNWAANDFGCIADLSFMFAWYNKQCVLDRFYQENFHRIICSNFFFVIHCWWKSLICKFGQFRMFIFEFIGGI